MKEIIYIQAGSLANYTGTHFWNTQESYLADESVDSEHNFEVSFREGLSETGRPSFCPRLLVFDKKANFGTLAKTNALLGSNEDELPDEDFPAIWNGSVTQYRQDPIPKSAYHSSLDESDDYENADKPGDVDGTQRDIRYWSDFNRVYYIPRTVQKIPDPAEWESSDGDWNMGQELFSRYDEENALMEGPLRLFLEECDSPQGMQIMNDTESFGGFINSFLTSFRDEFAKLSCLVVPLLSDAATRHIDIDDYQGTKKLLNDALYLRTLNEFSSMSIPIQPTQAWPSEAWSQGLMSDHDNLYHNSAILSAHIETSTLPLRLKNHNDLASICAQLNYRGTTSFGELTGIFPVASAHDFKKPLANFSASHLGSDRTQFHQLTRLDVTRGLTSLGISAYDGWSAGQSLQDTFISRIHLTSYPIPTSYPAFFKAADGVRSYHPGILSRPVQCPMFSSVSTSSGTARLFSAYATAIETCLKRKLSAQAIGIDGDDLRDLVNDLWTLHDNFDDGGDTGRAADDAANVFGEDEE